MASSYRRGKKLILVVTFIGFSALVLIVLLNGSALERSLLSIITGVNVSPTANLFSFRILSLASKKVGEEKTPTLVYTCLGEQAFRKHQTYIWKSLEQSRLIGGPSLPIVIILTGTNQTSNVEKNLKRFNVTSFFYEDLLAMNNDSFTLVSNFRRAFFVQGAMVPAGNVDFNQLTTERLFAVHAYMNVMRKSNVFHMENDNMLYFDLVDLMHRMHRCNVHFGLPRASPPQALTSFIYIEDARDIEKFALFIIDVFQKGRAGAMAFLNTTWINDMSLSGRYLELFGNTPEQSRETGVVVLPTRVTIDNCCLCTSGKEPITFDGRVLGQYFGGWYWQPGVPFWIKTELVDPRGEVLVWKEIENGVRVPYIREIRIVNLHVHSKRLERFSSIGNNQTTGKGFNFTIEVVMK